MEIWIEEPYGTLSYNEEEQYISMKFVGDIPEEGYKKLFDMALEKGVELKCYRLLIDQREAGFIRMTSRAWLILNWIPRSKKHMSNEDRKLAVLPSQKMTNKTGLSYLLQSVQRIVGEHFEVFAEEKEAMEWLLASEDKMA